jgi:hypothetical protein
MVSSPARFAASQSHVESPDHHAVLGLRLLHRRLDEVGLGFGGPHVGRRRPAGGQLAGRVPAALQLLDELAGARERLDLVDHVSVQWVWGT